MPSHAVLLSPQGAHTFSAQNTLDALEIDLSLMCDVRSTNSGAIFELNMFGHTSLIILRPSTGSYAFSKSFDERELTLLFRTLHNQVVVLGRS